MFKRLASVLTVLCATALITGCATAPSAAITPGANLARVKTVYVVKQPKDKSGIDDLIAVSLEKRGYSVTKGPELTTPYKADVAVTYVDKWHWDLTMYMTDLTINLRDPQSGFPMAVGHASYNSITRKSPPVIVETVLDTIFKSNSN